MSFDIAKALKNYAVKTSNGYTFKHAKATRYPIVPFSTSLEGKDIERLDFKSFDGIIGYCYRKIIGGELPNYRDDVNYKVKLRTDITNSILNKVKMSEELKDRFMSMIVSMFFNGEDLAKYSPRSQAYLYWKKKHPGLENIADFVGQLFLNEKTSMIWKEETGFNQNIFQKLLDTSLPKLNPVVNANKKLLIQEEPYRLINPEIIELFERDFIYLYQKDKQSFLAESDMLFKFYYFLYVSQLGMSLNGFFDNKKGLKPLYFTLETETVSENRKTIKLGWKRLEPNIIKMMSHSANLDMLNRLPLGDKADGYNYNELRLLFAQYNDNDSLRVSEDIDELINFYSSVVNLEKATWDDFQPILDRINKSANINTLEKKVIELFERIEFQFDYSSRKSKRLSFANWFIFFCKQNFLKSRGRNGLSLNLSHEMLIFLTKLCIGDRTKIRINDLMAAFEERGIYFDDATKKAMLDIYEKINLIEKKSDSGDAQYIRQIL